jgi:hypothetical protein
MKNIGYLLKLLVLIKSIKTFKIALQNIIQKLD